MISDDRIIMRFHFVLSLVCLLISSVSCAGLRIVPSRARHSRVKRSDYVKKRIPQSESGEPLAYELSQARFSWPLNQINISSQFGRRWGRHHAGIDIAAPTGTPVKAARSGRVIYASQKISGYGKMVVIRHSPNFATVYAHLSRIGVRVGDKISRGQLIGKVGSTGRSTNPHLHFEIRHRRRAVDPLLYLPRRVTLSKLSR